MGMIADYETDEVIQKSLREELGNDVTLLTIAHRLQTIMDADKIVSTTSLKATSGNLTCVSSSSCLMRVVL